jgi:hypothetical protein
MAEEYFIREPEQETASGPFTIDALLTLAEAGKLGPDHYYFDQKMESWVLLRTNEALMAEVFPEKKRLSLRKKSAEEIHSINQEEPGSSGVNVEELLAAAEGHTAETKHVRTKRLWQERTAAFSVPTLGAMLLISALSVLYPSWSIIEGILNETEGSVQALFQNPVVFLGGLDLLMGVFLLLNATEIFPLIRFRAMLGAGFFVVLYAANGINGDPAGLWMALSSLAFGFGLFTCTLTLNFALMVFAASVGIAGALGIAWYANLVPLFFGS